MKASKVLPGLLLVVFALRGQTPAKSTPTPLEAFVLSQPSSAVNRQPIGRIVDGDNSVAVNAVIVRSKDKEMRGFEFVVATASKRDSIYLDQDRLKVLIKAFIDGTMEKDQTFLVDHCKERGSNYGWDATFPNMAGDPLDMHTLSVGWLYTGSEDLGTMIQIPNPPASGFVCPLPNTPVAKLLELINNSLSRLNPDSKVTSVKQSEPTMME